MIKTIEGHIVDVLNEKIFSGEIIIENQIIRQIIPKEDVPDQYIIPGLIDSHVHIESSMLVPSEFAKYAVKHGTVSTVSDPHEIANVLGIDGINFMILDARRVPLKFFFGAPSCVPATPFDNSGACLNSDDIDDLLQRHDIYFLSEMMNFPGVIRGDNEVLKKVRVAQKHRKVIDGHAPALQSQDLRTYIATGINTDHESTTYDEAKEKIQKGMMIQIREGSAAQNFDDLYPLIDEFPEKVMLCCDDLHPDDLINSHINAIVKRGIDKGLNIFNLLRAASINPIKFYKIPVGTLRPLDKADFVIVDNLKDFNVKATYIDGECVWNGHTLGFNVVKSIEINHFNRGKIKKSELKFSSKKAQIEVIDVIDRQLLTKIKKVDYPLKQTNDIINKIVLVNRYKRQIKPAVGFVHGFNMTTGAIASSIAHDSHNIIAIGANDDEIKKVVNRIIELRGGLAVSINGSVESLLLNIGGIMTNIDGYLVAQRYHKLQNLVKSCGCDLNSPFMTLSFMALLVIPEIKLGDKGLFDVNNWSYF
jgi:adenine deaminase